MSSNALKHLKQGPTIEKIINNKDPELNEKREKFLYEFIDKYKGDTEEIIFNLSENLINNNEKQELLNKLEELYIIKKLSNQDFDIKKGLKEIVKTMSFEYAGNPSEGKKYLEITKTTRKAIIEEIMGQNKNNFKEKLINKSNNKKYETILNNLLEQGQISQDTINQLQNQELDNINFEKVENISEEEKKVLEQVFSNIKNPEQNKKSNLENLKKDIKEIQNVVGKENFDFNLEQNSQNFSQEVLNKIGGNYLSIQNKDGKINYEKNFSLAIDTTKIQIENGVKNIINKDSETYKKAIKNIESDNLVTKLEGIQSLYVLAYSGEGKFAKKNQEKYKKHRGEKLYKKYEKLNQELQELQKQQTEQAKKKIEQIKQEIESIQKEKKELESGDIFNATKLDTNKNNIETKE